MSNRINLDDLAERPGRVAESLARARVVDPQRGVQILTALVDVVGGGQVARRMLDRIAAIMARLPDPDRGLTNLGRVLPAVCQHCVRDFTAGEFIDHLDEFLWVISSSQYIADQLVCDPGLAQWLLQSEGERFGYDRLRGELQETLGADADEEDVLRVLRRTRHRHIVRIGFWDLLGRYSLEQTTRELSDLADLLIGAALDWSVAQCTENYGVPRTESGEVGRICVLGMGKLGGQELNYSSDVDLIFFYDEDGFTDGARQVACEEFWRRVAARTVRLLTSYTSDGYVYRVDLRLRPDGRVGAMVRSLNSMMAYYQTVGRTWELQAMIKARPCAGDLGLGRSFLQMLQPLVFRRYLAAEQIAEIKLIKKRIEERSAVMDGVPRDVKLSSGGIRDVEFVVQFLQLLHGAAVPELRERNTIRALCALEQAGCLTAEERQSLEHAYRFLRTVEHRLQLYADRQTHELPSDPRELAVLARKMGYEGDDERVASAFLSELRRVTAGNRRILSYLLQDAFRGRLDEVVAPESELVLDTEPDPDRIIEVLGKYGFQDPHGAHRQLVRLASEPVPFLSSLRCRHQMAAVAPRLLRELARYPDPDRTLARLEVASRAMGARGALWELFRLHPEAMKVVLDICAYTEMLYQMLCSNPGMFDDLVDALELRVLPDRDALAEELDELLEGARDPLPTLHNFKAAYEFRTGIRLLLGKDRGLHAARALRDVADVLLVRLVELAFRNLVRRYGVPLITKNRGVDTCRWSLLVGGPVPWSIGAFLDPVQFVIVYEGDGVTRHETRKRGWEPTTNQHFFHELARGLTAVASTAQHQVVRLQPGWPFGSKTGLLAVTVEQLEASWPQEVRRNPAWAWSRFLSPNRWYQEKLQSSFRLRCPMDLPGDADAVYDNQPLGLLEAFIGHLIAQFPPTRRMPRDPWDAVQQVYGTLFDAGQAGRILRAMQFLVELRQLAQLTSARSGEWLDYSALDNLLRTRRWMERELGEQPLDRVVHRHAQVLREALATTPRTTSGDVTGPERPR